MEGGRGGGDGCVWCGEGTVGGAARGDPLEINRHAPCPSDNKESE